MHVTRIEVENQYYSSDQACHLATVIAYTRHAIVPLACSAYMSPYAQEQDVRAALICDAVRQLTALDRMRGGIGRIDLAPLALPRCTRQAA
ncbi:MAG: hypothetical protein AB8B51_12780 [Sedimentitalea sp.]